MAGIMLGQDAVIHQYPQTRAATEPVWPEPGCDELRGRFRRMFELPNDVRHIRPGMTEQSRLPNIQLKIFVLSN